MKKYPKLNEEELKFLVRKYRKDFQFILKNECLEDLNQYLDYVFESDGASFVFDPNQVRFILEMRNKFDSIIGLLLSIKINAKKPETVTPKFEKLRLKNGYEIQD